MKKLERAFIAAGYNKITLNVSLDPTERKDTVLRRLNYYIGLDYRAVGITYRAHGVLINMEKMIGGEY
jgi:hypothetical protein